MNVPAATYDHSFSFSQHLRAVLTSKDDKETIAAMESELKQDPADPPAAESVVEPHTAGKHRCPLGDTAHHQCGIWRTFT